MDFMTEPDAAGTIEAFFRGRGKRVVTFAGFGELGYEHPDRVSDIVRSIIGQYDPADMIVNTGTLLSNHMEDGIAMVLAVAKEFGCETSSIYPGIALRHAATHRPSPFADTRFFVDDHTWGGIDPLTGGVSETLRVLLAVTDEFVAIGGGRHTADELETFLANGKLTHYFEAAMRARTADDWCRKSELAPLDHRGEALLVWQRHKARQTEPGSEFY